MKRLDRQARLATATVGLIALLTVQACGAGGGSGSPAPTDPPVATPTLMPTAEPTVEPTAGPATPAPDGTVVVDLANATDHAVTARITDESSLLASAESGQPGDGMSVRWHESILVNDDDAMLRLTWVGLPLDDTVEITITGSVDDLELTIVQKGPPINSDAVGYDRVLNLTFSEPVRSEAVTVTIEDAVAG